MGEPGIARARHIDVGMRPARAVNVAQAGTAMAVSLSRVSESEWVTHREAAQLLGVHVSLIPKMLRRGDLTSRGESPALSRRQVVDLAAARAAEADERKRLPHDSTLERATAAG